MLAEAGFYNLFFDYPGTGDAAHSEHDRGSLQQWVQAIEAAGALARSASGCARVAAVGVRFGAVLACLAARRAGLSQLALWFPSGIGRKYVRELRAMAMLAGYAPRQEDQYVEIAGFCVARDTLDAIQAISADDFDLTGVARALVVCRDDATPDEQLERIVRGKVAETTVQAVPGYLRMLCECIFTEIPEAAIENLRSWLAESSAWIDARPAPDRGEAVWAFSAGALRGCGFEEWPMAFGASGRLFGMLCVPEGGHRPETPVVIMLNAGSDHHTGPGNLYVKIARAITRLGVSSLRMDLRGLGDSAYLGVAQENHPYQTGAGADLDCAIDALKRRLGGNRWIPLGLSSGATHALRFALEAQRGIVMPTALLINPFEFHVLGDTAEQARATDTRSFIGRLRLRRVGSVLELLGLRMHWVWTVQDYRKRLLRRLAGLRLPGGRPRAQRATGVPRAEVDLQQLQRVGRKLTIVLGAHDRAMDVLSAEGGGEARRCLDSGAIQVVVVPQADHIFTSAASRDSLIATLLQVIEPLARASADPAAATPREAGDSGCGAEA